MARERRLACERVREAVEALRGRATPVSHAVLQMRVLEGRGVDEVATALGLTPEQVWYRQHRLMGRLRELLSRG